MSRTAAEVLAWMPDGAPENLPEVTIDFSHLSFIRSSGVVFLSNLIWWLHHHGAQVQFSGTDAPTQALRFLDEANFFEHHCGAKLRDSASPPATTQPLVRLSHQASHAWLGSNFVPWLAEQLDVTEPSVYVLKVCISELFDNIKDHAGVDAGSMFAQFFPETRELTICVADCGVGIPHTVRERIPNASDAEAIIYAAKPGFTSKSTPWNMGSGLTYLLQTIVARHGGQVTIYSGNSMVDFMGGAAGIRPIPFASGGFSPGTMIDISLRTDSIDLLPDETEDLRW